MLYISKSLYDLQDHWGLSKNIILHPIFFFLKLTTPKKCMLCGLGIHVTLWQPNHTIMTSSANAILKSWIQVWGWLAFVIYFGRFFSERACYQVDWLDPLISHWIYCIYFFIHLYCFQGGPFYIVWPWGIPSHPTHHEAPYPLWISSLIPVWLQTGDCN